VTASNLRRALVKISNPLAMDLERCPSNSCSRHGCDELGDKTHGTQVHWKWLPQQTDRGRRLFGSGCIWGMPT